MEDAVYAITEICAPIKLEPEYESFNGLTAEDIAELSRRAAIDDDPDDEPQQFLINMKDLQAVVDLNNHKHAEYGWQLFDCFDSEASYEERAREVIRILNHDTPIKYIESKRVSVEQVHEGLDPYLWSERDSESFAQAQEQALAIVTTMVKMTPAKSQCH